YERLFASGQDVGVVVFLDTAGGIRMGNPGDDATGGGNPGKAARAVGELDLAVVAPIGAAEGCDGILHHRAGDSSHCRNDLHVGAPSRRGEEAYRFTVGGKEWSKRTLGIGKPAGNRLVEIAHPEAASAPSLP